MKGILLADILPDSIYGKQKGTEVNILKTNISRCEGTLNLTRIEYVYLRFFIRNKWIEFKHMVQIKSEQVQII